MKEKYLPIGTVVLLKEATKRLMIVGYCSAGDGQPDVVYDYVAYLFPEGNLAGEEVALFNHDQIGSIVHMGLADEEFQNLDTQIKKILSGEVRNTKQEGMVNGKPNMNEVISVLDKNSGDNNVTISPPPLEMDATERPVFSIPSLGGNEKKEPRSFISLSNDADGDESDSDNTSESDGQPVLQLQPIMSGEQKVETGVTATSKVASSIPKLEHL